MNEFQFNLVKFFLDGFKVTPQKLARSWRIDLPLVKCAAASPNYAAFCSMPQEDRDLFGGVL